jgi:predicted nucleotidyltransferase
MADLAQVARRSDAAVARARADLVQAVRAAAARGMTQAEIGRKIGRSQPEVSRLLHFHGTSPRAMALRRHRHAVRRLIREAGGRNLRVFGSVATGTDRDGSDIDLLFTMGEPLSLLALGRLESRITDVVGVPVDLVPDSALRPELRDRAIAAAVPL